MLTTICTVSLVVFILTCMLCMWVKGISANVILQWGWVVATPIHWTYDNIYWIAPIFFLLLVLGLVHGRWPHLSPFGSLFNAGIATIIVTVVCEGLMILKFPVVKWDILPDYAHDIFAGPPNSSVARQAIVNKWAAADFSSFGHLISWTALMVLLVTVTVVSVYNTFQAHPEPQTGEI